jgi:16S rRNA (guanine966-N2)-methyltransferase
MPTSTTGNSKKPGRGTNQLRIVGGKWRSRRLPFVCAEGVRPTLDRFRETLFNWLMFDVEGACCLDLFAGSGALGLEALSRGAKDVVFIDASPQVIRQIKENLYALESKTGRADLSDAMTWLQHQKPDQTFDIVFLDPPFHSDLLTQACSLLETAGWLSQKAFIYVESPPGFDCRSVPEQWRLNRSKSTKAKEFYLFERKKQKPGNQAS